MYKLYKIANRVNEKLYIGITKLTLAQRWAKHCKDSINPKYPIHRAIAKYGVDNFYIELLVEVEDRKTIGNLEETFIIRYNSRENGYNVAKGGYGGDLGPEANLKRRNTMRNKSPEEKKRISSLLSRRRQGRTKENDAGILSQSIKVRGNQFRTGIPHSSEGKEKISAALKGKPKSDKTRQRMSESAIINNNGSRFSGRRACCLCCRHDWDIGNFTKHIRKNDELQ